MRLKKANILNLDVFLLLVLAFFFKHCVLISEQEETIKNTTLTLRKEDCEVGVYLWNPHIHIILVF